MIDPEAETFIVQRQGDQLMIQRVAIDRLTVRFSARVHLDGYQGEVFAARGTVYLEGTLDGGGLFDPGDAAQAFVQRSLET